MLSALLFCCCSSDSEVNAVEPARRHAVAHLGKTAVKAVNANGIEEGTYYSLNGMKVDNPSKGLYIKNGKKVIL